MLFSSLLNLSKNIHKVRWLHWKAQFNFRCQSSTLFIRSTKFRNIATIKSISVWCWSISILFKILVKVYTASNSPSAQLSISLLILLKSFYVQYKIFIHSQINEYFFEKLFFFHLVNPDNQISCIKYKIPFRFFLN